MVAASVVIVNTLMARANMSVYITPVSRAIYWIKKQESAVII